MSFARSLVAFVAVFVAAAACAQSASSPPNENTRPTAAGSSQPAPIGPVYVPHPALELEVPHSRNPLDAYRATRVPQPDLANTPHLDDLIHNGILQLSLHDAIVLSLADNLDLSIARYNLAIARADVLRTEAGGVFRGVNTGIVQNTPGGGVGGFGSGEAGAGAGGTTGGAGGAGTGASGLVQSTLGTGTAVNSYDPLISANADVHHYSEPLSNTAVYGVQLLHANTINGNIGFSEAFPTGTNLSFTFNNDRVTSNSPSIFLNPELDSYYQVLLQQQLLAGFGFGPNLRYLRIARNNQKISDQAFELQVITTITQIANIYWDLVSAYEEERVKSQSLAFAQTNLVTARKELALQAIPALDVLKDETEVADREGELTIARSQLHFQELLIKNALTKNLDDPTLEAMPVQPTDLAEVNTDSTASAFTPGQDIVAEALRNRLELAESGIDLRNRAISEAAARNALLPSLALVGYYGGSGLGGPANPASSTVSTAPVGYPGTAGNAFNNSAPDYYVGLSLNVPLRNRIAKSDQYRSELERRQAELRAQQLRKQIRIEVRNAQYALDQNQARVAAAGKARDLAARTFDITGKEQTLGAGSAFGTLAAQRDLATADSNLVAARTSLQKARIELDRALGRTLQANGVSIESARAGSETVNPTQISPPQP